ncbi:Fur family transcriptional regulator [Streptomyces sp. NPDC002536]
MEADGACCPCAVEQPAAATGCRGGDHCQQGRADFAAVSFFAYSEFVDFSGTAQPLARAPGAERGERFLCTVYRTLTALAGAGRADIVRDTDGERLFRHRPGPDHRHYLICTECGLSLSVESGPVERRADRIAWTSTFANVRHAVELSGVCPDCGRKTERQRQPEDQWSSQCPSWWACRCPSWM